MALTSAERSVLDLFGALYGSAVSPHRCHTVEVLTIHWAGSLDDLSGGLASLSAMGLLQVRAHDVHCITDDGLRELGKLPPIPSSPDLRQILESVRPGTQKIFACSDGRYEEFQVTVEGILDLIHHGYLTLAEEKRESSTGRRYVSLISVRRPE